MEIPALLLASDVLELLRYVDGNWAVILGCTKNAALYVWYWVKLPALNCVFKRVW